MQCRELGEVKGVNATGYKCFEEAGEKLYRIWVKVEETEKTSSCSQRSCSDIERSWVNPGDDQIMKCSG